MLGRPALSPPAPTAGNLAAGARLQGVSNLRGGRRGAATGRRRHRRRRPGRGAGMELADVQAQRAGARPAELGAAHCAPLG
eukprot:9471906-Pyramimonas_sp.AAC.1